jgi:hypothetical protein
MDDGTEDAGIACAVGLCHAADVFSMSREGD